jgi:hypothetical protein
VFSLDFSLEVDFLFEDIGAGFAIVKPEFCLLEVFITTYGSFVLSRDFGNSFPTW